MLHKLTPGFLTVNLLRTKLADDPHSVGSLNHVHLTGLVLLPVSLASLDLSSRVQLARAKVSSASVAVHLSIEQVCCTFHNFRKLCATIGGLRLVCSVFEKYY